MAVGTCVAVTAGLLTTVLPTGNVTLKWIHSVEKVPWEEDYLATTNGLIITEACVRRSGAGMEPPASARFDGIWWRYKPALPALPSVALANSTFVQGYQICWGGRCQQLSNVVSKGHVAALESASCKKVQ